MSLLKEKKFVPNLCELCDKHFPNAFEFFKHKAETHKPLEGRLHDSNPRVFVKLIMSRYVEVGINGTRYDGKELLVPEESASDITRIISEAYGSDTIIDAKVQLVKLNS